MHKTRILLTLILLSCLLWQSSGFCTGAEYVVDESFDDFATGVQPSEWVISPNDKGSGTYGEISSDPDNPQNKALLLRNIAPGVSMRSRFEFPEVSGIVTVEFRVRYEPAVIQHLGNIPGVLANMMYMGTYIYKNGGSSNDYNYEVPNVAATYQTWINIRYEIDFYQKTYNIVVNDSYYAQNFKFMNEATDACSAMEVVNNGGDMYFDDIKINYVGGKIINYTNITSERYIVDANNQIIREIPFETEPDTFLSEINFVENAEYTILDSDMFTPFSGRYLTSKQFLKVTSPNLEQEKIFKLSVRAWRASTNTVSAASEGVVFLAGSPYYILNGHKQPINEENAEICAFQRGDTMYIPLRACAQGFGAKVVWNDAEKAVFVDGKHITEGILENGTMFVTVEQASRLLAKQVLINEDGLVVITGSNPDIPDQLMDLAKVELRQRFE